VIACRQWVYRLLVLTMVPVLIVTSGNVAEAATYGDAQEGSFSTSYWGPSDDVSCEFTAVWKTDVQQGPGTPGFWSTLVLTVNCADGWGYDGSPVWIQLWGLDNCTVGAASGTSNGGWSHNFAAVDPDTYGCFINRYCWAAGGRALPLNPDDAAVLNLPDVGCATLPLGLPESGAPAAPGNCLDGDVWAPEKGGLTLVHPHSWDKQLWRYTLFAVTGQGTGAGPWSVYLFHANGSREFFGSVLAGTVGVKTTTNQGAVVSATVDNGYPDPTPNNDIVGVGMWRPTRLGVNEATAFDAPRGGGGSSQSFVGITDPAHCAFYWGAKIASTTSDVYDEPVGAYEGAPVAPPDPDLTPDDPTLTDDGCPDFDWNDPSTWGASAACAMVSGIKALIDAIGDMVGDFVSAVGDVLDWLSHLMEDLLNLAQTLFVPDVDSWGVDDLKDQVDAKPPFSVVSSLTDGVGAAAGSFDGGCSGDLYSVDVGDAAATSVLPCGGPPISGWAGLMALVRTALLITTGFVLWNIFSDAIARKG
jgi:hypothetical protein